MPLAFVNRVLIMPAVVLPEPYGTAMSTETLNLTPDLHEYLLAVGVREPPVLAALREETAQLPAAIMQISPEQGQFMAMLVRLMGARRTLEVGTFTGYSALAVALAMPADSLTICCDVSEEWTAIAQRYWREAQVADNIELHLRPATETLGELLENDQEGTFDFAFIDADKSGYDTYYEQCLKLLRPGGLVAVDNVLWSGAVIDPGRSDDNTRAIRALNEKIGADERVDVCLVPIGDGIMLARKR